MSLLDQFNEQYANSGASVAGGKGDNLFTTFDLCDKRNHGSICGRLLKDSKGAFFRLITGYHSLRVLQKNDDGKDFWEDICWIDVDNYNRNKITLTEDQIKLHTEAYKLIQDYLALNSKYFARVQQEKFIMYIIATQTNIGADGKKTVYSGTRRTVIHHNSKKFLPAVMDSMKKVVNFYDEATLEKFFARTPGETSHLAIITTKKGSGFGYEVTCEFKTDLPGKAMITDQILKDCNDLKDEIVTVNKFDEEYYKGIIASLKKSIALHANVPALKDHVEQPVK